MGKSPFEGRTGGARQAPFANMAPGETRTHFCADGTERTITRTDRPFVEDLVDSMNAVRTRSDAEWFVDEGGNPKLRTPHAVIMQRIRAEQGERAVEHRDWMRRHERRQDEAEMAQRPFADGDRCEDVAA